MTKSDRAAASPWTLKTVVHQQGGFKELARQSPLTTNPEQQLRLINGMYAGGEPEAGQLIKIVE